MKAEAGAGVASQSAGGLVLREKRVVEPGRGMESAVMDVHGGEVDAVFPAGEPERHRMDLLASRGEAEHREAVVREGGQAPEDGWGKAEARVEPREVGGRRDVGGLEGPDALDREDRLRGGGGGEFSERLDLRKARVQVRKEARIARQVDELDGPPSGARGGRQREHHRVLGRGVDAHLVDQGLAAALAAGEDAGRPDLPDRPGEDAHGEIIAGGRER
jgi:hypothetical protein